MSQKTIIIAFDGTAASGKGTIAKKLAKKLKYDYLDTGLMFRKVASYCLDNNIDISDEAKVCNAISNIDFSKSTSLTQINSDQISNLASQIAIFKTVREKLLKFQREFANNKNGVIIDGRDIGTVVFPNADFKFFFDADIEERAYRRYKQLQNMGKSISMTQVLEYLKLRDSRDKGRKNAPLIKADDSIVVNTTKLDIDQVLNIILNKLSIKL